MIFYIIKIYILQLNITFLNKGVNFRIKKENRDLNGQDRSKKICRTKSSCL